MKDIKEIIDDWNKQDLSTPNNLKDDLKDFMILFSYNNGVIENSSITYHDTRRVYENEEVECFTGNIRTLYELSNNVTAVDFIIKSYFDKRVIDIEFIKELNKVIMSNCLDTRRYKENGERAGQFKKHEYVTGRNSVGVLPSDVEPQLKEMLKYLNDNCGKSILKLAAIQHCLFEWIHPFSDGNGRTGRWLLNYYLMINNYPPLIIFKDAKGEYYSALEKYDLESDPRAMFQYLEYSLIRTYNRNTNTVTDKLKTTSEFL